MLSSWTAAVHQELCHVRIEGIKVRFNCTTRLRDLVIDLLYQDHINCYELIFHGFRCSEKAAALRPPPPVSLPPILPITTVVSSPVLPNTTVVSSSTSGRVPIAELAYNATVFSEGDPTVSVSVVGEGESALMLSTCRAVQSTTLFPSKLEIRQASTFTGSILA